MLRKIIFGTLFSLAFFNTRPAQACDACGGGIGSYQVGFLPQSSKNFVGIRYQAKSDRSTPHHDITTSESFRTTEVWGRFYPLPKVQVLAILPYSFNEQTIGKITTRVHGFGDVLVMANYNLVNNTDSLYQKVKHNLLVGGGLKLATGDYKRQVENNELNPNLQLGSGSYDLVANLIYTVRLNNIGVNSDLTYKYNTANQDQFRFGNRIAASSRFFSVLKFKEMRIMPNAGLSIEGIGMDSYYGSKITESGGHAEFVCLGTETFFKQLSGGITFHKPVNQNLSAGHVKTGNRLMTHLTFMF